MAFTMNADGRAVHYRCWVELKNAEGFFDNLVLPEQEGP